MERFRGLPSLSLQLGHKKGDAICPKKLPTGGPTPGIASVVLGVEIAPVTIGNCAAGYVSLDDKDMVPKANMHD